MEIKLTRSKFTTQTTLGVLTVDGKFISDTLEDTRRFPGIKVQNETCIPAGRYRVALSMSHRFKKIMPMLYNCANERGIGYEIKAEGISFTGIRMHRGVTHKHTAGCILYRTDGADVLMLKMIEEAKGEVWIDIVDAP